jgi:hypothetical protein
LGALGLFLLTGVGATLQLARRLIVLHHWLTWEGSFEDVVPYLDEAHVEIIDALRAMLPELVRAELVAAIRQLTEPQSC